MAFPALPTNGQQYTTTDGRQYIYSLANDAWEYNKSPITTTLNNTTATTDPTAVDSTTNGYSVGSLWINVSTGKTFFNTDATAAAAVWTANGAGATIGSVFPTATYNGQLFYNNTTDKAYMWTGTAWVDLIAGGTPKPKINGTATVAPTATNDSSALQSYSVGSMWIDIVANTAYVCVDDTVGAAIWNQVGGGQGWVTATTLYTALGNDAIFVDTTALPSTVTLPAAPVLGMKITIVDHKGTFATNSCTVARNGKTIMGLAAALTLATNNRFVTLAYDGVSDWRITA